MAFAQEFRGTISGAVTDATGGTVAGAKIAVTETHQYQGRSGDRIHWTVHSPLFCCPATTRSRPRWQFKEYIGRASTGAGEHPVIDDTARSGRDLAVGSDGHAAGEQRECEHRANAITTKEVEDRRRSTGFAVMLAVEIGVIYSPFNSNSPVQQVQ